MILLTLPYPVSANRYWGTRVMNTKAQYGKPGRPMAMTYVTKEAEAYKRQVWDAWAAAGYARQLTGRIALAIRLFPSRPQDWATRQRKHGQAWDDNVRCIDLDNANKVLMDALKGVAFEDDRWVFRLQCERMEPDQHGARVIVAIEQLALPVVQGSLLEEAA
ncbi:MAG: hypothetical protein PVS3B2_00160 [Candidatus Dormibacteraceae bacterium]